MLIRQARKGPISNVYNIAVNSMGDLGIFSCTDHILYEELDVVSTPRQVLQDSIRRKILLHFPIVDVTLITNYNLDLYISEPAQKDETVVELKVSIHKLYIIFAIYES